jgi:hypothetical protein
MKRKLTEVCLRLRCWSLRRCGSIPSKGLPVAFRRAKLSFIVSVASKQMDIPPAYLFFELSVGWHMD